MKADHNRSFTNLLSALLTIFLLSLPAFSQACFTADDMDAATRTALQSAGTRYFDILARGDSAAIKQNSIPSLAADFAGLEGTIKENQANLAGGKATPRPPFMLKAEGTAP